MKKHTYLLRINVGPKKLDSLVFNENKLPVSFLEEMAANIIATYIEKESLIVSANMTIDTKRNKMKKSSGFSIEDLSELTVYNPELKFEKEQILNSRYSYEKKEQRGKFEL